MIGFTFFGVAMSLVHTPVHLNDVVDAWQISTWDEYADVQRLGRKTRIGLKQREVLWRIFEKVRAGLAAGSGRRVPRRVGAQGRGAGNPAGPGDVAVAVAVCRSGGRAAYAREPIQGG